MNGPPTERTRPVTSGAGIKPDSDLATCRQPTCTGRHRDYERGYEDGFCSGWFDRSEYARRGGLTFDDGYELGWAAAARAMRNAMAEAVGPLDADAASVVRRLLRGWDHVARRAEADRPGARPGDYLGRAA